MKVEKVICPVKAEGIRATIECDLIFIQGTPYIVPSWSDEEELASFPLHRVELDPALLQHPVQPDQPYMYERPVELTGEIAEMLREYMNSTGP